MREHIFEEEKFGFFVFAVKRWLYFKTVIGSVAAWFWRRQDVYHVLFIQCYFSWAILISHVVFFAYLEFEIDIYCVKITTWRIVVSSELLLQPTEIDAEVNWLNVFFWNLRSYIHTSAQWLWLVSNWVNINRPKSWCKFYSNILFRILTRLRKLTTI